MAGREKGKIPIRDVLKKKDSALYHRLEAIWAIAQELQERQRSKEGHQQGPLHCGTVEENLDKLIPDDQKRKFFTPPELFLFSAAACYHDIGKSGDSKEEHGIVAMKDIFAYPEKYGLTDPEGKVLSYIIGSHDTDEVFEDVPEIAHLGNEDIRVRILSALFRLSDVLHTDHSRISHIHVGDAKKEDEKTRFRNLIKGWGFNKNSQIELTAVPENHNDSNIIEKGVSMMREQIECIAPVLQDEGYPYKISIYYDNRKLKWEAEEKSKSDLLEMDYYTEKDASIFRGRNNESHELLDKVFMSNTSKSYTTLLIGNSGVGKTSLIRAGLFPILTKMGWKCVWTRPLNPEPLRHILEDINNACMAGSSSDVILSIKDLSDGGEPGILIAIDQFEDILRSQPHEREQVGKILRRIYSKSFRNIHVLLSYRGDYETEIFSFLENASITRPEKYSLRGFDKSVASDVLRSIFLDNSIGIDDALLGRILDQLDKKSEVGRIYPPFIQIIAKCLIDLAGSKDYVVTEELYNQAGRVENIIGTYLISQLRYFDTLSPPKERFAEEILKHLVRDRTKEQKGKDELARYLKLPENELQELLDLMVKKRLIRHLGSNDYEIIHDFLASGVEEMIKDDEKPLRSAISTLRTKTLSYQHIHSLLDANELISLYSLKESIHPSIQEKELLMYSYLAGNGPAWWWFREDEDVLRTFIKKGLSNRSERVRSRAVLAFEKLGNHNDLEIIKDMLKDNSSDVRRAAVSVFEKLGNHNDLEIIKDMLKDGDWEVGNVALSAFGKLGTHDDLEIIKDMLTENDFDIRSRAVLAFEKLGTHDDLKIIKDMLKDYNWIVRGTSVLAIGKLGTHDDLEIIKDMFRNPDYDDSDSREAVISAFEKLATHDDLELIQNMLKDDDSDVRRAAVSAFEKLATCDDLELIQNMLKDNDWKVKYAAVSAFEKLGNHNDLEIIKNMLKDNSSDVRRAAVSTFEKLGNHNDLEIIKNMLKDNDWQVRQTAMVAFEKFASEKDLMEMTKQFAKDEFFNDILRSIISLDEKFYSPNKNTLSFHKNDSW